MNKRKVVMLTVTYENGECDTFAVDATMSESLNARKKGGFANLQEWVEYHITWVNYVRDLPNVVEDTPVGKADREALKGKAWCAQHGMEPHECFPKHNPPTAYSGRHPQWNDIEVVAKKELPEIFKQGKQAIMRAYGLTEEGLRNWLAKEESMFPEFDLSDLKEGYGNGNGHIRPE